MLAKFLSLKVANLLFPAILPLSIQQNTILKWAPRHKLPMIIKSGQSLRRIPSPLISFPINLLTLGRPSLLALNLPFTPVWSIPPTYSNRLHSLNAFFSFIRFLRTREKPLWSFHGRWKCWG
ncbi:hypothetical protein GPALN_003663 [Globodera pallida]|nr:hypothetical protein GPALN_003663 [Globodera pallida]